MWSISKTLDLFKGTLTPENFSDHWVRRDELSYRPRRNSKKAPFFLGDAKSKQDHNNHLHQPLLDNDLKGGGFDETKFVDHRREPQYDSGDKKANLRVKIKMTKEEAARLLAKCRDQKGTLEFRDVALELVKIPSNRIIEISSIENCSST